MTQFEYVVGEGVTKVRTGQGFVGEAGEEGAGIEVGDHGNVTGDAQFARAPDTDNVSGNDWVWAKVDAADGTDAAGCGFGVRFEGPC